ncbi:MAG TPA: type II toxin-antitoxin system VapC family toxin [Caldimonas sp.]
MSVAAVVLDASTTAAWLLPDEASDSSRAAYRRLRRGALELHAPQLWLWECGNIIANGVKRRRIAPADALLTWSVLDAVRARVELMSPEPSQVRAALVLAIDHGLSLYDAAYLWLALSLQLPLLTADVRLRRAADENALAVVAFDDVS